MQFLMEMISTQTIMLSLQKKLRWKPVKKRSRKRKEYKPGNWLAYCNEFVKIKTMAKATKVAPKKDAANELQEFFEDGLKDIYWAEKALVKSLPKMQKNATSTHLKAAIGDHLEETKTHVTRVEQVFESIGKKA